MKSFLIILSALCLSVFTMGASGCGESKTESALEDAGEKMEETAEKAMDAGEEAMEKAKEAVQEDH